MSLNEIGKLGIEVKHLCIAYLSIKSVSINISVVVLAIVVVLLSACAGMGKSKEIAERAVEIFHSQLDSERYVEIYADAEEEFKKSGSQEQFEKLMKAIHQKLGKVQATNQTSWLVNVGSGAVVTLTYNTDFADGKATEQFVWHVRGNRASLLNYTINSADLVTK
jgi:hypothetical protein